jgi:predicted RNA-binding Zn-ribbon protein involved in translation (DUF1610 family)
MVVVGGVTGMPEHYPTGLIIADRAIQARRVARNMIANHPSIHDAVPRRKTVLFCPECGHESAITGGWIVSYDTGREVYECPSCGATVITQTRLEPPTT